MLRHPEAGEAQLICMLGKSYGFLKGILYCPSFINMSMFKYTKFHLYSFLSLSALVAAASIVTLLITVSKDISYHYTFRMYDE
jgi:hypothetical protein